MELLELFNAYSNVTEPTDAYIISKAIIEELEKANELLRPELESLPIGDYINSDVGKKLSILESDKSSIDKEALNELTDDEIRKTYKITETALKSLGEHGKEILSKFKVITKVRSLRVTKLEA